jgi:hypothetical protein
MQGLKVFSESQSGKMEFIGFVFGEQVQNSVANQREAHEHKNQASVVYFAFVEESMNTGAHGSPEE